MVSPRLKRIPEFTDVLKPGDMTVTVVSASTAAVVGRRPRCSVRQRRLDGCALRYATRTSAPSQLRRASCLRHDAYNSRSDRLRKKRILPDPDRERQLEYTADYKVGSCNAPMRVSARRASKRCCLGAYADAANLTHCQEKIYSLV